MNKEEFNVPKEGGSVFDLPLSMRKVMHEELTEILEGDGPTGPDKDGNVPGYQSDKMPAVYLMSGETAVVGVNVYDELGEFKEMMALNIDLTDLERLIEE